MHPETETKSVALFDCPYCIDDFAFDYERNGRERENRPCYLSKLQRKLLRRWSMNWRIRICTSESAGPIPISASARRKRNPWLSLFARPSGWKPARPPRITSASTEDSKAARDQQGSKNVHKNIDSMRGPRRWSVLGLLVVGYSC